MAACLALSALAGLAPARASALEPPRPLPGTRPAFVTETDEHPWRDCLWASAAMLLDKWTAGDVQVTHQRLRTLSGDAGGGSSFEDMAIAFRRLGFKVQLTASGDSTLTWSGLLRRLRKGAGAVVLGDYGDLPRWYGRWDYRFWRSKGKKQSDDHAIYVERYDPRHGRVWVMDPLGRAGYRGEWMSIGALHQFAWFAGGRVQAIATPTAKAAPFQGVRLVDPTVALSDHALTASWGVDASRRWRFGGADVRVTTTRPADVLLAAARAADAGTLRSNDAAPARPVARGSSRTLEATTALPTTPGAYSMSMTLTDRRFGRRVVTSSPTTAFVPGAQRATIKIHVSDREPGIDQEVRLLVSVANEGRTSWADPGKADADGRETARRRTRLVATWIPLDADATAAQADADTEVAPAPEPVVIGRVPLDPGRQALVRETVAVPSTSGRWALVIDVVDDADGSFATLGSAPGVALLDVVPVDVSPTRDLAVE